jgi:hypothetical protein
MTSRLATNYTITWAGNNFTITYASTYSPLVFSDAEYIAYVIPNSSTYVNIGPADGAVTLNWSLNTNLGAVSASDLLVKMAALTSTTASFSSIATDSITSLTTNGNLVLSGNGTGIVRVNDNLGLNVTPDSTCTGLQFSPTSGVKQVVCYTANDNVYQYCGLGMKSGAMSIHLNDPTTNLDFDVGQNSTTETTKMRLTGAGGLQVQSVTSIGTNTHLDLTGNGTGSVRVMDALIVDSITSLTTNGHLDLTGNGSGVVRVTDQLAVDTIGAFTSNGNVTLNGNGTGCAFAGTNGLKFVNSTTSYTPTALTYYEQVDSSSLTVSGCFASNQSVTAYWHRIGRQVTFYLATISAAAAAALGSAASGSIPTRFRPLADVRFPLLVINNSAAAVGWIIIANDGSLTFSLSPSGAFSGTNNNGWNASVFTYLTA